MGGNHGQNKPLQRLFLCLRQYYLDQVTGILSAKKEILQLLLAPPRKIRLFILILGKGIIIYVENKISVLFLPTFRPQ